MVESGLMQNPSRCRPARILLAGLNLVMLACFRLVGFDWGGGGILLDASRQSSKLIAVWKRLEPLPLIACAEAFAIAAVLETPCK